MSSGQDRSRGHLIAFEGVEGAGKSTQIEQLATSLRGRGWTVHVTREPGGTALGAEIRRLVLAIRDTPPTPLTELLLYLADRAQHIGELILPAIERGEIVLTDRFSASTIAYQGYARPLDREMVIGLDAQVRGGVAPTLNVLLDCPVEIGLRRARDDDRFHREDLSFHQRVRDGFLDLARRDPTAWAIVDATANVEVVAAAILSSVLQCLGA